GDVLALAAAAGRTQALLHMVLPRPRARRHRGCGRQPRDPRPRVAEAGRGHRPPRRRRDRTGAAYVGHPLAAVGRRHRRPSRPPCPRERAPALRDPHVLPRRCPRRRLARRRGLRRRRPPPPRPPPPPLDAPRRLAVRTDKLRSCTSGSEWPW